MPLTWSIRNVRDCEALIDSEIERPITEAVVFMTMAVGIDTITEKNIDEFYFRSRVIEEFGPFYRGPAPDHTPGITREMIARRVGLNTNASRFSRKQFRENIGRRIEEKVQLQIRNEASRSRLDAEHPVNTGGQQ